MILIDDRAGSKELIAPLKALGLPVEATRLAFGDLMWIGRGVKGQQLSICIEHKKLSDLIGSMATERLAGHQLPGMLQAYDRCYLIIEGEWQRDSQGKVSTWSKRGGRGPLHGAPGAIELLKRIHTLQTRGGLIVWPTANQRATCDYIQAIYRGWTDKDLDKHVSHLAIAPDIDMGLLTPSTFEQAVAAQLPGVGYTRSRAVCARFKTVEEMTGATIKEWMEVEGIGKTMATNIYNKLRGKK